MKVRVASPILCISLICSLISHIPVSGDELDSLRKVLTGPLVFAVPAQATQVLSFFAFLFTIGDDPVSTDDLMKELKDVHAAVVSIKTLINRQPEAISDRLMQLLKIENDEDKITDIMSFISHKFRKMHRDVYDKTLLQGDAETFTEGHGITLRTKVEELVDVLNPITWGRTSLIQQIYNDVSPKIPAGTWCANRVSLNEYIYRKYRIFMMSVSEGYALLEESYRILAEKRQADYNTTVDFLRQDYYNFKSQFGEKVAELMAQCSLSIRRCDPPKHDRDENFLEFERLMQGNLVHTRNLSPEHPIRGICEHYAETQFYHDEDFLFVYDRPCWDGEIFECRSSGALKVCPATIPSRRFDGLITKRDFPNVGECSDEKAEVIRHFHFFENYPVCLCLCDAQSAILDTQSFRHIDVQPVYSQFEKNMVITGLRLVKNDNCLRIEVQEGHLGQFALVNASSVRWRNYEEYRSTDEQLYPKMKLTRHFRSINLNIITPPFGFAMIGVQFTSYHGKIQLRVYTTKVFLDTGKLDYLQQLTRDAHPPTKELRLEGPLIPSLAPRNARADGENKFIMLQISDWIKDGAQTIVPFLDIQEVVTNPPTVLGGVNFAYRTTPGYGGFLSLELQSWPYTDRVLQFARNQTEYP